MDEIKKADGSEASLAGDNRLSVLSLLPTVQELYGIDPDKNEELTNTRTRLKKQAFYEAIAEIPCPHGKLDKMLATHEINYVAKTEMINDSYEAIRAGYNDRIDILENEIAALNDIKNIDEDMLQDLKDQKLILQTELENIRNRLYGIRYQLAKRKQLLLEELPEEVEKDLKKTLSLQNTAYDELYSKNDKEFAHNRNALNKRLVVLENLQRQFTERLEKVHTRLKVLAGEGINPYATYFLISVGMAAIGATGILYSTFTYTANFGNQDFFNFLFSGFISGSRNQDISFWYKLGGLMGGLALVTLVAWLCYLCIDRIKNPKKDKDLKRSNWQYQYKSDRLSMQVHSKNWYLFWLQVLPVLLFFGVVILLLSFNKDTLDADRLSSSTEGLLLGSAMALGLAGVTYLYIVKIIEPRLVRMKSLAGKQTKIQWARSNWELVACISLFIVCTVSIIFLYMHPDQSSKNINPENTVAIAILKFIAVSLLAAVSLAYGIRCRGLIALAEYLKRDIIEIQDEINTCVSPAIPAFDTDYATPVHDLIEAIVNRLKDKAAYHNSPAYQVTREYYKKPVDGEPKTIWKIFSKKRAPNDGQKDTVEQLTWVTEWEAKFFPEFNELILRASDEYAEKEKELKAVQEKIDALENNVRENNEDKENALKSLRAKQQQIHEHILRLHLRRNSLQHEIAELNGQEKLWLTEGFHLGIWYRENQIGPVSDYYSPCKKAKDHEYTQHPAGFATRQ